MLKFFWPKNLGQERIDFERMNFTGKKIKNKIISGILAVVMASSVVSSLSPTMQTVTYAESLVHRIIRIPPIHGLVQAIEPANST